MCVLGAFRGIPGGCRGIPGGFQGGGLRGLAGCFMRFQIVLGGFRSVLGVSGDFRELYGLSCEFQMRFGGVPNMLQGASDRFDGIPRGFM